MSKPYRFPVGTLVYNDQGTPGIIVHSLKRVGASYIVWGARSPEEARAMELSGIKADLHYTK